MQNQARTNLTWTRSSRQGEGSRNWPGSSPHELVTSHQQQQTETSRAAMATRRKRADADDQKKLWTLDSSKSRTEQSTKRENRAHQGRDEVAVESDEDGKGRSACWFARRGRWHSWWSARRGMEEQMVFGDGCAATVPTWTATTNTEAVRQQLK